MSMKFTYDKPVKDEQLMAPLKHFLFKKLGDRLVYVKRPLDPDVDWRYFGVKKWNPHASFVTTDDIEKAVEDMIVVIGVDKSGILELVDVETIQSPDDYGYMLRFLYSVKEDKA